ncbi:MAG: hypothetical protein R3B06_32040 [Kofleriaceae bacterium]
MRALSIVPLVLAAACFSPTDGGTCGGDGDCGAGAVCTRIGECSSQPYALRVTWTVNGAPASPTACAGIGRLELTVADPAMGTGYTVAPVPCPSGAFLYDKLPPNYTTVELTALDQAGNAVDRVGGTAIGGAGVVALDLRP